MLKKRILEVLEGYSSFCLDDEDERKEIADAIADMVEEHQERGSEDW